MIKAILVFNNHGKPRMSKFYQYFVSTIGVVSESFHIFKVIIAVLNRKITVFSRFH